MGQTWFDDRMPQHASIDLGAMISGIQRWVETESPTSSKAAVNRMVDMVQADVADLPVTVERVPGRDGFADNLIVRNQAPGSGPGILIMSHIDTVHPIGTLAGPLPFRRDGDKLYGPGLFDMKGGRVSRARGVPAGRAREVREAAGHVPVHAGRGGRQPDLAPSDRGGSEKGALCARHRACRDGGKVVTSRKGVGRFEMKATGVPAHSGARHQDGRSAIREMARQVLAIEEMTDYARGVTTTVGVIRGGTAPNVIPQHCHITVDLRVRDEAAGAEFEAKILGLEPVDPGVKLEVTGGMNRPPFEMTHRDRGAVPPRAGGRERHRLRPAAHRDDRRRQRRQFHGGARRADARRARHRRRRRAHRVGARPDLIDRAAHPV